ncbi:MAG: hypothetical protein VB861_19060 [Planctomycetaceae bacterium]
MKRRLSVPLLICALLLPVGLLLAAAVPSHKLARTKALPQGVGAKIATKLDKIGFQISGSKGPICTVWLVKDVPIREKFKPGLSIKYPFTPGQLVGLLQVQVQRGYTDFRGAEMKPGVYTLRYGQQPVDGNHVGTSELADFLLALPAKTDLDPKPITGFDELAGKSAVANGTTHPAILSLLPATKPIKVASLSHDEDHDFWILSVAATAKATAKAVRVNLRFVAIGQTTE